MSGARRARPARATRRVAALAPLALALLGLVAGQGCSALPWPQRSVPAGQTRTPEGYLDLRGVVHVHTRDSHDSPGRIQDVVSGARGAGVVWVALTEHTRPGGPPNSGRFDGVLVIPGYELRAWGGSLLALGIEALPSDVRDPQNAVREIHAAGGLAFVAHLDTSQVSAADWAASAPDGLEIANLHANAIDAGFARLLSGVLLLPAPWMLRALLRMPQRNLELWDSLADADAIVGGVDAHAKLHVLGPLGDTVDTYGRMFRLLTTHVLARAATRDAILEALRAGRSYVAFEGRGRVDAFRFARDGDAFEIEAPRPARLVLSCDGQRQEQAGSASARFAIPPHAVRCRAEAWQGDRPWILSSAQRIGAPGAGPD